MQQVLAAETEDEALAFLSDALTMAEPEGYVRTFVDEGTLLKPLLKKVLKKGIMSEYTKKLLTLIEMEELQRRKTRGDRILLSEREIEILHLIDADNTNEQIADNLSISLSTVKTHVHHILEKLSVKDRSQAVFRAKELELI